jgi:hypothetical protein
LSIGTVYVLMPIGGSGGTLTQDGICAAGEVAVGDLGSFGSYVDSFGLSCATPTLVVQ